MDYSKLLKSNQTSNTNTTSASSTPQTTPTVSTQLQTAPTPNDTSTQPAITPSDQPTNSANAEESWNTVENKNIKKEHSKKPKNSNYKGKNFDENYRSRKQKEALQSKDKRSQKDRENKKKPAPTTNTQSESKPKVESKIESKSEPKSEAASSKSPSVPGTTGTLVEKPSTETNPDTPKPAATKTENYWNSRKPTASTPSKTETEKTKSDKITSQTPAKSEVPKTEAPKKSTPQDSKTKPTTKTSKPPTPSTTKTWNTNPSVNKTPPNDQNIELDKKGKLYAKKNNLKNFPTLRTDLKVTSSPIVRSKDSSSKPGKSSKTSTNDNQTHSSSVDPKDQPSSRTSDTSFQERRSETSVCVTSSAIPSESAYSYSSGNHADISSTYKIESDENDPNTENEKSNLQKERNLANIQKNNEAEKIDCGDETILIHPKKKRSKFKPANIEVGFIHGDSRRGRGGYRGGYSRRYQQPEKEVQAEVNSEVKTQEKKEVAAKAKTEVKAEVKSEVKAAKPTKPKTEKEEAKKPRNDSNSSTEKEDMKPAPVPKKAPEPEKLKENPAPNTATELEASLPKPKPVPAIPKSKKGTFNIPANLLVYVTEAERKALNDAKANANNHNRPENDKEASIATYKKLQDTNLKLAEQREKLHKLPENSEKSIEEIVNLLPQWVETVPVTEKESESTISISETVVNKEISKNISKKTKKAQKNQLKKLEQQPTQPQPTQPQPQPQPKKSNKKPQPQNPNPAPENQPYHSKPTHKNKPPPKHPKFKKRYPNSNYKGHNYDPNYKYNFNDYGMGVNSQHDILMNMEAAGYGTIFYDENGNPFNMNDAGAMGGYTNPQAVNPNSSFKGRNNSQSNNKKHQQKKAANRGNTTHESTEIVREPIAPNHTTGFGQMNNSSTMNNLVDYSNIDMNNTTVDELKNLPPHVLEQLIIQNQIAKAAIQQQQGELLLTPFQQEIITQVEYYFSEENLQKDAYWRRL